MKSNKLFTALCFVLLQLCVHAQQKDSLVINKNDSIVMHAHGADTVAHKNTHKKKFDPRKASLYSAILPGAGQVYNKKYWKVPIVYAAIGIPAYTYFYNKSWYKKCQYALAVAINHSTGDSLNAVDPRLRSLAEGGYANYIINYRDEFRKDQDYSALFFLIFWGLNVIDATVDAHLKGFNVNDDLSLRIKPMIMSGPNAAGLSFVFDIHKARPKPLHIIN